MFCCSMLIALSSFSQSDAKIEVAGTDTFARVPISNIKQANTKFIDLQECEQEKDSLFSQIRAYTGLVNNQRDVIKDLKLVISTDGKLLADKQKLFDLSDLQFKSDLRKIKWLKLERNAFIATSAILVLKIIFSVK